MGALDAPPPSPQMPTPPNSYAGMAPQVDTGAAPQMPPEVLTGITQVLEKMHDSCDSLAQALPQLASDFQQVQQVIQGVAAKVMMQGSSPSSPTNAGPGFPGGGMDSGFTPPQSQ